MDLETVEWSLHQGNDYKVIFALEFGIIGAREIVCLAIGRYCFKPQHLIRCSKATRYDH